MNANSNKGGDTMSPTPSFAEVLTTALYGVLPAETELAEEAITTILAAHQKAIEAARGEADMNQPFPYNPTYEFLYGQHKDTLEELENHIEEWKAAQLKEDL